MTSTRDWSSATDVEIEAEICRLEEMSDDDLRVEFAAGGEDLEEVAAHTREVLLAALASVAPAPEGYEIDGPYMGDQKTGRWDATVRRRRVVQGATSRADAIEACELDMRKSEYGQALNEIAKIAGCGEWDRCDQVVRDVQALVSLYVDAAGELKALSEVREQYKDVQVLNMSDRRMIEHYKVMVDKNRELERKVRIYEEDPSHLSGRQFAHLEELLDNPPAPNDVLRKLMSTPSVLEVEQICRSNGKAFDEIGCFVEECGEVIAEVGKMMLLGIESTNPELPPEQQETNRDWILRELPDLRKAIAIFRASIDRSKPSDDR